METKACVALVTGGASGLGRAVVEAILARGGQVAAMDLDADKGRALAAETGAAFFAGDVRSESDAQAAVDGAVARYGHLNALVHCAGVGFAKRVLGKEGVHPLEDFHRVIDINLAGTFNMLRLAARAIAQAPAGEDGERGVIITTASFAAFEGQIGQAAYAAAKGGIVGMTLPVARELARFGIRCNTIAPGIMDTPMSDGLPPAAFENLLHSTIFPKRLGASGEFASLALQILENRYLNAAVIRLDGAVRLPPR